jgi:hypothetical protein
VTDDRAEQLAREVWAQVGPNEIAEAEAVLAAIDAAPGEYGYRKIEHGVQDFPFSVTYGDGERYD